MKKRAWWIFGQTDKYKDKSQWKDISPVPRETISEEEENTEGQAFFPHTDKYPLRIADNDKGETV
jgi:hypothetical protein